MKSIMANISRFLLVFIWLIWTVDQCQWYPCGSCIRSLVMGGFQMMGSGISEFCGCASDVTKREQGEAEMAAWSLAYIWIKTIHIYLLYILGFYKCLSLKKLLFFLYKEDYENTWSRCTVILYLSLLSKNSSMGKTKLKMEANTKSAPKAL